MTSHDKSNSAQYDLPRAGILRRLAALLYDGFLVAALWFFIGYAMLAAFGTESNQLVDGKVETDSVVSNLTFLLMVASSLGFYLWFGCAAAKRWE